MLLASKLDANMVRVMTGREMFIFIELIGTKLSTKTVMVPKFALSIFIIALRYVSQTKKDEGMIEFNIYGTSCSSSNLSIWFFDFVKRVYKSLKIKSSTHLRDIERQVNLTFKFKCTVLYFGFPYFKFHLRFWCEKNKKIGEWEVAPKVRNSYTVNFDIQDVYVMLNICYHVPIYHDLKT